ncbi:MAG: hypothetical protein PF549_03360 [Patescibacteria group bacterium]|jgi:hypothetical protein|nr:hypothetical protein [Patescibacteria group bacterium]
MAFRKDLPEITISLGKFQKFDHHKKIKQPLPAKWNLKVGDLMHWECCQFDGITKIKEIENKDGECICSFSKIS